MAELVIHRGTNEIGGSAIEISDNNSKLLFDFGIPLESMEKEDYKLEDYKLKIDGLHSGEEPKFNAVFLTHAHPDHFGLIKLINSNIPIFVNKVTYDILTKIVPLLPKQSAEVPNLHIIEGKINFGNMTVSAHNVDHSVAGACAYEIKAKNKTIVYTGDFRFHGRASWLSSTFKNKMKSPDYLIMEGTTLSRKEQDIIKEEDLETEFIKLFKSDKLPLVLFSSQNLDRFITVYRACLKAKKTLVIDPYTCCVLEVYSQLSKSIPQYDWNNIRVMFSGKGIDVKLAETKKLYQFKSKKITIDEISEHPENFVIKGNGLISDKILNTFDIKNLNLIFSMWKGYIERNRQFNQYKDKIIHLHVSGHSYIKDLQKFVKEVQPKNLIPVHTECKDKYKQLFSSNIIELNDGQSISI